MGNGLFGILTIGFLLLGWFGLFLKHNLSFWKTCQYLALGIVLSYGLRTLNNFLYLEAVFFTGALIIYFMVVLMRQLIKRITRYGVGSGPREKMVRDAQKEVEREKVLKQVKDLKEEIEVSEMEDW